MATDNSHGIPFKPGQYYTLTAAWRYSNGNGHFAYDLAAPIGTVIVAPSDCFIVDLNDGVPQNRPGQRRYSGMPSNWIITKHRVNGKWVYGYFQHLRAGILVKKGQRVKQGMPLAFVGLTGNTTGPHLHYAASDVRLTSRTRYAYMNNSGRDSLYPPTRLGDGVRIPQVPYPGKPLRYGQKSSAVKSIQARLGLPMSGWFGPETKKAVIRFQRSRPWLWPADGVVGPMTYKAILRKRVV